MFESVNDTDWFVRGPNIGDPGPDYEISKTGRIKRVIVFVKGSTGRGFGYRKE